jgi:hypothetical protein
MSEGSGPGADTRNRVIDTVLTLLDEGDTEPGVDSVSERSGVARHVVKDYLADRETLLNDIVTRRLAEIDPWLAPFPAGASRDERIAALVTRRAVILEWLTPARLAAMRYEAKSPRVWQARDAMYTAAKSRTAELFAAELDPLPPATRDELLDALDAVTMWGTWHHWRTSGLDTERASRAMTVAVTALLDAAVSARATE